jgi:hypothetical protein
MKEISRMKNPAETERNVDYHISPDLSGPSKYVNK